MPHSEMFSEDGFTVSRTVVGPLDNNVYLVVDDATGDSIIVDAADDASAVLDLANGTSVQAIVTTHGHWDHHQATHEVADHLDVPALLHPDDSDIAEKPFEPLRTGSLSIGESRATVIQTPGHTPGSVCIALPGVVLTGDTLFPGGPGATRFPYSDFGQIIASIEESLFAMPDETVVLPGHGDSTTIGTERPSLPAWIDRGW
ncbi:MAG: MBL fold metallo-hydrolase [Acidimicrobiia bacterium]